MKSSDNPAGLLDPSCGHRLQHDPESPELNRTQSGVKTFCQTIFWLLSLPCGNEEPVSSTESQFVRFSKISDQVFSDANSRNLRAM
jgi:hypothetical protein